MNRALPCLLFAALLPTLSSCGDSTNTIDKDEIAAQAQTFFDRLAEKQGRKFPPIKCPEDLEAKEGEKTRCSAAGNDGTLGITVTVTEVREDDAQLNFKGDEKLTKP